MKKERNYQPVMMLLILAVVGVFAWMALRDWNEGRVETARKQETEALKRQADTLSRKVTQLEQELKAKDEVPSEEKAAEVFGRSEAPAGRDATVSPDEVERRIRAFFSYLDGRDYIRARELEGGVYPQYLAGVEALAAHPPRVTGETESLFEMLKNVSYLYRVLGKQRLQIVADVLEHESEILEPTMRAFYQWYSGSSDRLKGRPSLATQYAYASYLVDTFGGRSYLLRRDSRTRLLTMYYCILVLDRSNDQKLNPNGIDIRPLVASTARDMRAQRGLTFQKQYLAELDRLARKYP
ncbi:MAG: hypothetical protein MUE48_09040 [Desulfobacterales bacterium]|nr:hypothetical protein [Desulfobacterales bacterium]